MNNDYLYLNNVVENLLEGNIYIIPDLYINLPNIAYNLINTNFNYNKYGEYRNEIVSLLVYISDILYNNTSLDRLPLDDSIYDRLFEYCANNGILKTIGSKPIEFDQDKLRNIMMNTSSGGIVNPVIFIDKDEMLYMDNIFGQYNAEPRPNNLINPINTNISEDIYIDRRVTDTSHMYPELVGTLRKSRSVLVSDVAEDLLNDPTYRILERDFFGDHIKRGILDPNRKITVVVELKYDGISIEADTSSIIHSARTRGDTSQGVASDMTPLLYGYRFNKLIGKVPDHQRTGVKFEAIITKENLQKYNELRGAEYKNCRSAIVGLTSSSDGYKYRDLISLVPLAISGDFEQIDRLTEVQALNELYVNDVPLHYAVMYGTYDQVLFQIRKFVQEAYEVRESMPFMYDGIVVTYVDMDIRNALGRKDYINQYQEAVKFEAVKKSTTFLGYTYTVGQDGRITPMIHYNPVEFFGTIHDKSSGHSYQRVKDLELRVGDIIDVEYVGDVMPYVTKPDIQANRENKNPIVEFITNCPECGSTLVESESGKTMSCINIYCNGVSRARVVNMLNKLNIKDFGEARLNLLPIKSFKDLMELTDEEILKVFPTPGLAGKLRERIIELNTRQIPDYQIVGSLGFKNIASSSWKAIFEKYTLKELLNSKDNLESLLMNIPGIGKVKAETIINEIPIFINDLEYISNMKNIVDTKDNTSSLKIRFSGVRDIDLIERMRLKLHDAGEGSVTKDTDLLIIPNASYNSSKVAKARQYNIPIMTIDKAREKF